MLSPLNIPVGTPMLIGSPKQSMPQERSAAIARAVASVNGVVEARLPTIFVPNVMEGPAQVLALMIDGNCDEVFASLEAALGRELPAGSKIDIWVMPSDDRGEALGAGPQIFARPHRKPWWKF